MKTIPMYQVDAFASRLFEGNPAAVCPLERWLDDETLQAIAEENNLSETAFFVSEDDHFHLRWFTPASEVELCGHATLGAAHVILTALHPDRKEARFRTRSGMLAVTREDGTLCMDLPAHVPAPLPDPPRGLVKALGGSPEAFLVFERDPTYVAVYASEPEIRALRPDLAALAKHHPFSVGVTAPGEDGDVVSRYFAPSYGIDEDPVTGSFHAIVTPYWARRLERSRVCARQLSSRGGILDCELAGDRVILRGHAVTYLTGSIRVG